MNSKPRRKRKPYQLKGQKMEMKLLNETVEGNIQSWHSHNQISRDVVSNTSTVKPNLTQYHWFIFEEPDYTESPSPSVNQGVLNKLRPPTSFSDTSPVIEATSHNPSFSTHQPPSEFGYIHLAKLPTGYQLPSSIQQNDYGWNYSLEQEEASSNPSLLLNQLFQVLGPILFPVPFILTMITLLMPVIPLSLLVNYRQSSDLFVPPMEVTPNPEISSSSTSSSTMSVYTETITLPTLPPLTEPPSLPTITTEKPTTPETLPPQTFPTQKPQPTLPTTESLPPQTFPTQKPQPPFPTPQPVFPNPNPFPMFPNFPQPPPNFRPPGFFPNLPPDRPYPFQLLFNFSNPSLDSFPSSSYGLDGSLKEEEKLFTKKGSDSLFPTTMSSSSTKKVLDPVIKFFSEIKSKYPLLFLNNTFDSSYEEKIIQLLDSQNV